MAGFIAEEIFLTKGVGRHREKLTSLEMALRNAGIAPFNIVRVSSIFPPHCKLISKNIGLKKLSLGQILFCVMSEAATNEPNRLVAAAVGVAVPKNPTQFGYLSEHHSYGQTERTAGDYSEDIAAEMLATTIGVDFDPSQSRDEKREIWRISGQIVKTTNITQTAVGNKKNRWTTVIAGAILIL